MPGGGTWVEAPPPTEGWQRHCGWKQAGYQQRVCAAATWRNPGACINLRDLQLQLLAMLAVSAEGLQYMRAQPQEQVFKQVGPAGLTQQPLANGDQALLRQGHALALQHVASRLLLDLRKRLANLLCRTCEYFLLCEKVCCGQPLEPELPMKCMGRRSALRAAWRCADRVGRTRT